MVRTRCHLEDVSLVPEPAYSGTEVIHRAKGREDFALPTVPVAAQVERLRAVGITLEGDLPAVPSG